MANSTPIPLQLFILDNRYCISQIRSEEAVTRAIHDTLKSIPCQLDDFEFDAYGLAESISIYCQSCLATFNPPTGTEPLVFWSPFGNEGFYIEIATRTAQNALYPIARLTYLTDEETVVDIARALVNAIANATDLTGAQELAS